MTAGIQKAAPGPDRPVPGARILDRLPSDPARERAEVVEALRRESASIAPKYFYDGTGCALYGAICALDEYYPTRTEHALFESHRREIAAAIGPGRQVIDLGAGDGRKAEGWLAPLEAAGYLAVDIAAGEIARTLGRLGAAFPGLALAGLATDFSRELDLAGMAGPGPALFFYPGSSIGNFSPMEARAFLARIRNEARSRPGSALLIGVDGKKDAAVLDAAYDDALGVTAAFNLNVLRHLNARFGFDFDIRAFTHRGFYEAGAGRIEMHLEAVRPTTVRLEGVPRAFRAGERIHTENSYKYAPEDFEALLSAAGFSAIRRWSAPIGYHVFLAS